MLVYGVLGAIVLRTIMIFAGTRLSPVRMAAVCVRRLPAYRRKMAPQNPALAKTDGVLAARASAYDRYDRERALFRT